MDKYEYLTSEDLGLKSSTIEQVFNDLNKLIIDVNNNKVKKEDAVERLNKSIWLGSTKAKTKYHWIREFKLFTSYLIHLVLIKSLNNYLAK